VKAQVFKCLPCQVEVSDKLMLSMHLKGKKHQEKLAKLKEGDKPKPVFECDFCKVLVQVGFATRFVGWMMMNGVSPMPHSAMACRGPTAAP
jgi:hypothetical protein